MIKKIIPVFLIIALLLTGCSTVILENGTLSIDADDIAKFEINNAAQSGYSFVVQDRESISQIVRYINSYLLDETSNEENSSNYSFYGYNTNGDLIAEFTIVSANSVKVDGQAYTVDAKDLLSYTEKLECATLTDNTLIDRLFTSDTLDKLNILNEDGKISLDKIAGLSKSCPALFELIKRPSMIKSVGSYGLEALSTYLNSDDLAIKERAETIAALFEEYVPDLRAKIEEIIKNNQK